jgi:ferredoxin
MKALVDQDTCIGCGMCIDICPEVFKYNDEDKSESILNEVPEHLKDKANEAAEVCPVEAIVLE